MVFRFHRVFKSAVAASLKSAPMPDFCDAKIAGSWTNVSPCLATFLRKRKSMLFNDVRESGLGREHRCCLYIPMSFAHLRTSIYHGRCNSQPFLYGLFVLELVGSITPLGPMYFSQHDPKESSTNLASDCCKPDRSYPLLRSEKTHWHHNIQYCLYLVELKHFFNKSHLVSLNREAKAAPSVFFLL